MAVAQTSKNMYLILFIPILFWSLLPYVWSQGSTPLNEAFSSTPPTFPWKHLWTQTNDTPISLCSVNNLVGCFIYGPKKMDQSKAHDFCRSKGGFLPNEEELKRLKSHVFSEEVSEVTWSSLSSNNGCYQWKSRTPEYAFLTEWENGLAPNQWEDDCPGYDTQKGSFRPLNCSTQLEFLCIISETFGESGPDFWRDLKLELSANLEDENGWIELEDEATFRSLILSCRPKSKHSQDSPKNPIYEVFWVKDGKWLGKNSSSIHPASTFGFFDSKAFPLNVSSIYDASEDRQNVLRRSTKISDSELLATKQGTYCCQSWIPFSTTFVRSNCILITFTEWASIIITLKLEGDRQKPYSLENEEIGEFSVSDFILNITSNLFNSIFDEYQSSVYSPISISRHNDTDEYIYEFKYHLFLKGEYTSPFTNVPEIMNSLIQESTSEHLLIKESNVKQATYCSVYNDTFDYGNYITYPFARAGDRYSSVNFKCETNYNRLEYPLCQWDFTNGAELLIPRNCSRFEICPRDYKTIKNEFCVKILKKVSWEEGYKDFFNTGFESTLFENDIYFQGGNESIFKYIVDYILDSDVTNIWLLCKRKYAMTPIISYNLRNYESIKDFSSSVAGFNFEWKLGHPVANKLCVKYSIMENKFYSSECNILGNFAVIINLKNVRNSDDYETNYNYNYKSNSEYENNYKSNYRCKNEWITIPSTDGLNVCARYFNQENQNITWNAAKELCNSYKAKLPSPHRGFRNWYYKSLNNHHRIWINLVNDTEFASKEKLEYLNWIPETNYTKMYGMLDDNGWHLTDESDLSTGVICEFQLPIFLESAITIVQSQQGQLCVNLNTYNESPYIECFKNGNPISQTYTEDPKCPIMLKISDQGYYDCLIWSIEKNNFFSTNKFLYLNDSLKSFIVFGHDSHKLYDPMVYDSTFFNSTLISRFENTCVKELLNGLLNLNEWVNIPEVLFHSGSNNTFSYLFRLDCLQKYESFICSSMQTVKDYLRNIFVNATLGNQCFIDEVRSAKGCMEETTEDNYKKRNITWPNTEAEESAIPNELCVDNEGDLIVRLCTGNFITGVYWYNSPRGCPGDPSDRTLYLWKIFNDPGGYVEGHYKNLSTLTSEKEPLTPADFYYASSAFKKLSENVNFSNYLEFEEIVSTMNNLMGTSNKTFQSVYKKFNSSAVLIYSFEKLAFATRGKLDYSEHGNKFSSKENLIADCIDISLNTSVIGFKSSLTSGELLTDSDFDTHNTEVAIILPEKLTKDFINKHEKEEKLARGKQILFTLYKKDTIFHDPQSESDGYILNGGIIQATLENYPVRNLEEGVQIFYRTKYDGSEMKCVYWDNNGNEKKGGWSEEGCKLININNTLAECECNHLTIFSLLIKYDESYFIIPKRHRMALELISLIGCSFSIVGLLLVLITFAIFSKWRKPLTNKILANLSLAILLSLLVFVSGIDKTEYGPLCKGVAIILHYFILATFGWMLVEGVHQYLKFVKVIGTYIPRFMLKASICAWGIPLIPISIALVIDHDLYTDGRDGTICWMSKTIFLYSFLPSVSIILVTNICIFLKIIDSVIIRRAAIKSTIKDRDLVISQVTMAICIFFLLGFTWIFGFLIMTGAHIVFSYLFCIFHTLQGFFIFIFHLCRDRSAQRLWSDILNTLEMSKTSRSRSINYNQTHTKSKNTHSGDTIPKCIKNNDRQMINLTSYRDNIKST